MTTFLKYCFSNLPRVLKIHSFFGLKGIKTMTSGTIISDYSTEIVKDDTTIDNGITISEVDTDHSNCTIQQIAMPNNVNNLYGVQISKNTTGINSCSNLTNTNLGAYANQNIAIGHGVNNIYNTGTLVAGIGLGQINNPHQPNSAITISAEGGVMLNIHHDGRVEWTGPLSKNATAFVNVVGAYIDKDAAGKLALAKSYRRAIERCLQQIKQMDKDEFIAMLEKEVEIRKSKAVWQELSQVDDEGVDE
jgi:hypothetical protein